MINMLIQNEYIMNEYIVLNLYRVSFLLQVNGKPVQTIDEDYSEKRVEFYIHDDSSKIL